MTGRILVSNHPSRCASAARRWLSAANDLIRTRHPEDLGHVFGGESHVNVVEGVPETVVDHRVNERGVAHAHAVASRLSKWGVLLIDSMPPATTTSASPVATAWAASITAFKPDPQTLLMVRAATRSSRPARRAA